MSKKYSTRHGREIELNNKIHNRKMHIKKYPIDKGTDEVKLKDVEFDMMANGVSYKVKGKTLASCTQFDEVNQ